MVCRALFLVSVLLVAAVSGAHAQWGSQGTAVCSVVCASSLPRIISDGAGGAYVAWRDRRDGTTNQSDPYIQRITSQGTIAPGWPSGGLQLASEPGNEVPIDLAPDGSGGVLVVWTVQNPGTGQDLMAQRIRGDGTIAQGWPAAGFPVCLAPTVQFGPAITGDGLGGAFIAWDDNRSAATNGGDVYAQHITADGQIAPGWVVNGNPICDDPAEQGGEIGIVSDGVGGFVAVWGDLRTGTVDIFANRIQADGSVAPGWVANGWQVMAARRRPEVAPDGAGGFYVAGSVDVENLDREVHVQRFMFTGTRAPGWPVAGVPVCVDPGVSDGVQVAPDGVGGLVLTWQDFRDPWGEVYAARVLSDASLPPGWTANGTRVSGTSSLHDFEPMITSDGLGGAYVAWEWEVAPRKVLVQHITANGAVAPGWPPFGLEATTSQEGEFDPVVAPDGSGGAIVAWNQASGGTLRGIFAQRFQLDGPVPVLVSLVNSNATPERIRLEWHMPDDVVPQVGVYRRTESTSWRYLTTIDVDGTGRLSYEDHDITPGETYAYRLGWAEQGIERFSQESWIEVPAAFVLALEGLRPNPATGPLTVAFSLPGSAAGELELLDVTGRRVLARSLSGFGAGRHVVRLEESRAIAPGMYFVRLRHGGRTLLTRGAVVR